MILMTRSHDKILRWSNISDDQDDATNKFDMTARDYYPPLNSKHRVFESHHKYLIGFFSMLYNETFEVIFKVCAKFDSHYFCCCTMLRPKWACT